MSICDYLSTSGQKNRYSVAMDNEEMITLLKKFDIFNYLEDKTANWFDLFYMLPEDDLISLYDDLYNKEKLKSTCHYPNDSLRIQVINDILLAFGAKCVYKKLDDEFQKSNINDFTDFTDYLLQQLLDKVSIAVINKNFQQSNISHFTDYLLQQVLSKIYMSEIELNARKRYNQLEKRNII